MFQTEDTCQAGESPKRMQHALPTLSRAASPEGPSMMVLMVDSSPCALFFWLLPTTQIEHNLYVVYVQSHCQRKQISKVRVIEFIPVVFLEYILLNMLETEKGTYRQHASFRSLFNLKSFGEQEMNICNNNELINLIIIMTLLVPYHLTGICSIKSLVILIDCSFLEFDLQLVKDTVQVENLWKDTNLLFWDTK